MTIYHNPRCSKSRQTLALPREKGIEPRIIEYLKTPPSATELKAIPKQLGLKPRRSMRRKEAPYKAKKLDDESLSTDRLVEAMVAHPALIERPIVLANGKAALGRPPEAVLAIL